MKQFYTAIIALFISINAFSQQSYYSGINSELNSETGMTLFNTLAVLTGNEHTNMLSYTEARECLKIIDLEPGQSDNVLLIYGYTNNICPSSSGNDHRLRSVNSFGGAQTCEWNREHTFVNSLANPDLDSSGENGTAYSDAHNLRACDVDRNGQRGSQKFNSGSGNSGDSGSGWYPGDEWKGDVARIVMYMYLRYGSQCYPSLVANGTSNSVDSNMINLLLDWNAEDPVSAYEDARNTYHENTSNTYAQGNRNPFIDNPRLATRIWGGTPAEDRWGIYGGSDTEAPTVPTNLAVSNETSSSIDLDWTASTDNVAVTGYDIYVDGAYNSSSATNSHTVTGLSASTTYSFTVLAKDAANNMSAQSTAVNGTTTAASSGGSDLFFSEYMEGSSNNKALEIANVTGSSVDLSIYTIKKSVNGSANWDSTIYSFPSGASVANDDVYVVENSSNAQCSSQADDSTGSSVLQYNGNDPLGLFKNDVLIDIIGTLGGGSSDFAENITLVRNSNISSPNTTYTPSEWTSYAINTCDDLGTHTATLGIENNSLSNIKMYPNPANGNTLSFNTDKNVEVTIYNILGAKILTEEISVNKKEIDISNLKQGTYFVQLTSNEGTSTRRLIKQ